MDYNLYELWQVDSDEMSSGELLISFKEELFDNQ